MDSLPIYINLIFIIIIGMVCGSFITMASYRLSIEGKVKDLLLNPSSCPNCNHHLGAKNLIPIFSWIIQRGKCAFCRKKISIRYPIIEIISALSFVLIYITNHQKFDTKLIILFLIFIALFIMIITDLEHYFIPNIAQIVLFITAIFYHLTNIKMENSSYYFMVYYAFSGIYYLLFSLALLYIFKLITKRDGIGIDDIKFFAVAGFMLGINKFHYFIFLSGFIGVIFGFFWQKIKKDDTFPFAPAMIISLIMCILL